MKRLKSISFFLALTAIVFSVYSQDYHVRIGTIGNSITHGNSLPNPATQAYPIVLGQKLTEVYGDTCIVRNFGLTSTTMLKNGDISYWDTQHLIDYLAWAPEICFIMLGTNDTKPQNWDVHGDEFIGDYLAMIDTIKQRNPHTRFMLAYPPPAFQVVWDIRDSVIVHGVIPAIDSVLKVVDADLMDFYHPLLDSVHLFIDFIHPTVEGNVVMAEMLRDRMVETDIIHKAETGFTFITGFETEIDYLPVGDSSTLSWTTLNADSVHLNGAMVESEGSLKISPPETTDYMMIAFGAKSNDTIVLTQEVYTPELARLRIYPNKVTRYQGDTVFFQVYYHDQVNNLLTGVYFPVEWNLDGSGHLYEESDTSVFFVAVDADTTDLVVSYEEFSDVAVITVRESVSGLYAELPKDDIKVFPNPAGDELNIRLNNSGSVVTVKIYDAKGMLVMDKKLRTDTMTENTYSLKTNKLKEGTYILRISASGRVFDDQLIVIKR